MKKFIRIIPKLDIKNGLLIKGINLEGLRVLGEPFNFSSYYAKDGADEILYVDNVATLYGTNNLKKFISKTANNIFIPLSVGGGIKSIDEISSILESGADKVSINSALIDNPKKIKKFSNYFGSSTIISNVEILNYEGKQFLTKSNGRDIVSINPYDWIKKVQDLGAGEIFLTSVNAEGLKMGFDLNVIEKVSKICKVPLVVHGGAGNYQHVYKLLKSVDVDGVSIASMFHYSTFNKFKKKKIKIGNHEFINKSKNVNKHNFSIKKLKLYLKKNNISVRV